MPTKVDRALAKQKIGMVGDHRRIPEKNRKIEMGNVVNIFKNGK